MMKNTVGVTWILERNIMGEAIKIIAGMFAVAIVAAIALWNKIMQWAENRLFPWIKKYLSPKIEELTKEAFVILDKVAVSVRNVVKKSWQILRKFLLEATVKFEKKQNNKWIKKWTSKIIKFLDHKKPVVKVVEVEEEIDYDELPPDVRERLIRFEQSSYELDVVNLRDQEIMDVAN